MSLPVWSHVPSRGGLVPEGLLDPEGEGYSVGGGMALSSCGQTNTCKNHCIPATSFAGGN